ncbi:chorismate-binding protein, partial [Xanthomonas citri pv. citri]
TFPLAGTTKRGKDETEDRQLARALLNDPKEIAEHNMLVDLHRNDIGRVARFGTVKVRNLMDIKRFSHVQHISSEIVGILDPNHDMFTALASNFPAGTLSGAPKIEAMKIINTLEPDGRGAYGGALGQFCFLMVIVFLLFRFARCLSMAKKRMRKLAAAMCMTPILKTNMKKSYENCLR